MSNHPATGTVDPDKLARAAVELTAQLVSLDTVNPELVPGAAGEIAAVELLAERLGSHGFSVEVVHPKDPFHLTGAPRPSLIATATGSGGGPRLMLNGHLDTVGVNAMVDPFVATIEGDERTGRLHGRGACDMKGGVAAMVVAAEQAVATGNFAGEIILSLVADEEHASIGVEAVIHHLDANGRLPDLCLVAEPTWLDLVVAHRGFDVVEVELLGRAAHSSQPERGVDTVRQMGRLLVAVEQYDRGLSAAVAHHLAGHGSLLCTVVAGGSAPFTIAEAAQVIVERRTIPGESGGTGLAEVEQLLDQLRAEDPTLDASATLVLSREAWEAGDDQPTKQLLAALAGGLAAAGAAAPPTAGAPYWMESALWGAAGVPTVVCGPAGGGMHAVDEWLDLAQLRSFTLAVHHAITEICRTPQDDGPTGG